MSVRVLEGDALVRMAEMPIASIDACVTDPPYGLEFMSVAWDTFKDGRKGGERTPNTWGDHGSKEHPRNAYEAAHVAGKKNRAFGEFSQAWADEVLRVLKPGGYLVAFGGTRTFHRLTCAIEDSGFQIRDCLMWLYGSGFPKGKGCLKPAWEPIILARKPAPAPWLNVDGCRIGTESTLRPMGKLMTSAGLTGGGYGAGQRQERDERAGIGGSDSGRWPANVVLSHEDECREVGTKRVASRPAFAGPRDSQGGLLNKTEAPRAAPHPGYADSDGLETVAAFECVESCAVRLLDEQSGNLGKSSGTWRTSPNTSIYGGGMQSAPSGRDGERIGFGDVGGASRFFYTAKASPAERGAYNDHPTVKPLALMQWLVRLVTPTGGAVLDPFCGSGSTLIAADREGFDAIGIDQDVHAIEITRRRVTEDARMFAEVS